ncbi:MAG: hypothetical protein ISQ53_00650 [Synechococcus sp. BS307-5m-G39]|uniref:hypothetical protein n=1 Tax=Synechococcus sp. MEDNS5 TaxID=1442554 RepID=UPI0016485576|nr:hypothetical protein [Synechococcus sp. MEDNS5]MBL6797285.1 hypothetical protein [Synechococcus sp. BS307-5m-G39]QNJ06976.1 putative membrane protein [Synechococcus sp. MEDNS5]
MVQSLLQSQWAELFDVVAFFRSTLLPILIVALFALALVAVSARIWLPGDMLAPAPIS